MTGSRPSGAGWLHGVGWFLSGALLSAGILGYWLKFLTPFHLLLIVCASSLAGFLALRGGWGGDAAPPVRRLHRGDSSGEAGQAGTETGGSDLSQARTHMAEAADLFRGSVKRASQEMVILDMAAHGLVVELERSRGALDRVRRERGRFTRSFDGFVQEFSQRAAAQEAELEDALRFGLEVDVAARMVARIAKETAMIALNASLEAQRVGAEGAGFHVIALELRKLTGLVKEANDVMADRSRDIGVFLPSIAKNSASIWEACERVTTEMHGHVDALDAHYDEIVGGVAHALGGGETISERARNASTHLEFEESMAESLARADALIGREIALRQVAPRTTPGEVDRES